MSNSTIIENCAILNDIATISVFILVIIVSFCFLFIHKICFENKTQNKRTWNVWCMDNSKQFFSSCISVSCILSPTENKMLVPDQCALYCFLFIIDTILGVMITFGLSQTTLFCFHKYNHRMTIQWLTIGNYFTKGYGYKWRIWCIQTLHWNICYLFSHGECIFIASWTITKWPEIISWLSGFLNNKLQLELYFGLIILPLLLYTTQYLVQNRYLRRKSSKKTYILDTQHQPLIYSIV